MSRLRAWVINQAVECYLDYEEWFVAAVKRGVSEAKVGELLEHEAVVRRWESKRGAEADAAPLVRIGRAVDQPGQPRSGDRHRD